jgi:hypothetical protein
MWENGAVASGSGKEPQMARTVKLAPTEKSEPKAKQVVAPSRFSGIWNNLPAILGAAALVAAGALAGTALAHGGPDGRDGRHPGPGAEARMEMGGGRHGGQHRDEDGPRGGADLTGAVTSVSPTELSITLADGTSTSVVLDDQSQYFTQTAGTAADVTVGSYVLVRDEKPADGAVVEADGIAVLTSGLTDAHVHLGRPAKVTAVEGSTLTLEMVTPRGTKTITITVSDATVFSKIAAATSADVTAGDNVVVDIGREANSAKSVLIVK